MVSFTLHPRAVPAEQVHIYVDGVLVRKCTLQDRQARLAAHGHVPAKPRTHRDEQRERERGRGGWGFSRSGRQS